MKLGITEVLVVLAVALVVVGPDKLPSFAKKLGETLSVFKKATADATKELRESVVEPLNEAQQPLREALEPVAGLKDEVEESVKELKCSIDSIGKPAAPGSGEPRTDTAPDLPEAV